MRGQRVTEPRSRFTCAPQGQSPCLCHRQRGPPTERDGARLAPNPELVGKQSAVEAMSSNTRVRHALRGQARNGLLAPHSTHSAERSPAIGSAIARTSRRAQADAQMPRSDFQPRLTHLCGAIGTICAQTEWVQGEWGHFFALSGDSFALLPAACEAAPTSGCEGPRGRGRSACQA